MDGETLPVDKRAHLRVARLLCLLGAVLVLLYAPLYGAANANPGDSVPWGHLAVAGLLVVLIGASYVSEAVRRRHAAITWGLLSAMMVWATVEAALRGFSGAQALGVLLIYAVFGVLVALGSRSVRPVLAFLLVGILSVGGALLWAPSPQTPPWALGGTMVVVALVEGAGTRWALSVRDRLRARTRDLHEQRELLEGVTRTSPHAIVRVDAAGTLTDTNDRAEELLGPIGDETLGPERDAAPDEILPVSRVLRTGTTVRNQECSVEGPDGTQRVLSVHGAPVRGADGEIQEAVFHLHDVTDRERRKEALEAARAEAAEADHLKSALLTNMSHEIRTPLTAIIGFAEVVGTKARKLDLPDEVPLPGYADLIEQSGKRLLETFEGIMDLAQLEAGQMTLGAEPVDLHEQARRAVEEHRPDARTHEIDLQLEGSSTTARADADGVQIVLQNLLDNAIKYTEEGGTVWVRTYLEPGWAVLEVEDTGAGMEPEAVDQLFKPFRQASTGLSREYEGTGIGLAVTKEATEQMDGSVKVDTEEGTGSRFLARLPTTDPGAQDRGDAAPDPSEERPDVPQDPLTQ